MLSISSKFYSTYISGVPSNRMKPPPPNFFDPRTNKDYAAFLKRTVAIAESAVLIQAIAESAVLIQELREYEVQRSPFNLIFLAKYKFSYGALHADNQDNAQLDKSKVYSHVIFLFTLDMYTYCSKTHCH